MINRCNIAFSLTVPGALRAFMIPHLLELIKTSDITVYSNFSADTADDIRARFFGQPLQLVHIDFQRKISPLSDLKSWWQLFRRLKKASHSSVHSMMPKTGLLTTTAAWAARIPIRIHMFTGQVWASQQGFRRYALKALDRLTALAATHVLADSPSQRDFLYENGFSAGISVLGSGSVSGVNLKRFRFDPAIRQRIRSEIGLTNDAIVFGFLGRMNRDKGVGDLAEAFNLAELGKECHLVLVGPDEDNIEASITARNFHTTKRIHFCGHTNRPEDYLAMFDVYCLPSYREGFGTSVIEAAAMGIPALASRIYGLTDAVVDRATGLLHPAGDVSAISRGLEQLARDPELRTQLGSAARVRVGQNYSEEMMVGAMAEFYSALNLEAI
jgi:glycosyltransferase involved in cell wall biosynthesis